MSDADSAEYAPDPPADPDADRHSLIGRIVLLNQSARQHVDRLESVASQLAPELSALVEKLSNDPADAWMLTPGDVATLLAAVRAVLARDQLRRGEALMERIVGSG